MSRPAIRPGSHPGQRSARFRRLPSTGEGVSQGAGLHVLRVVDDKICAMTRFEKSVFSAFGLPQTSCRQSGRIGQQ